MTVDLSSPTKKQLFKSIWESSGVAEQMDILNRFPVGGLDKDIFRMIMSSPCEAVRYTAAENFIQYSRDEELEKWLREETLKDESEFVSNLAIERTDLVSMLPKTPEQFFDLSEAMRLTLLRLGNFMNPSISVELLIQILEHGLKNGVSVEQLDGYLTEQLTVPEEIFNNSQLYWEHLSEFPKEFLDTLISLLPCKHEDSGSYDYNPYHKQCPTIEQFKSLENHHQCWLIQKQHCLTNEERIDLALDPETYSSVAERAASGVFVNVQEAIEILQKDIVAGLKFLNYLDWNRYCELSITTAYTIAEIIKILPEDACRDDDGWDLQHHERIMKTVGMSVAHIPKEAKGVLYRRLQGVAFLVRLVNKGDCLIGEDGENEEKLCEFARDMAVAREAEGLDLIGKLDLIKRNHYSYSNTFRKWPELVPKLTSILGYDWILDIDETALPGFFITAAELRDSGVNSIIDWPPSMGGIDVSELPNL